MKKNSWVCTVITQLCLCFSLFLVLQIGHTQKHIYHGKVKRNGNDLYFISVRGGIRPLQEQSHLLNQIEKVIKAYKARFVINISELGEDDPLSQNATGHFRSFNVPWYATKSSEIDGVDYCFKKVKGTDGNSLDVIFVNTDLVQDNSNASTNDKLNWLEKALETSGANWRIIASFHPIVACNHNDQAKQLRRLRHIFLKHRVNAYISGQACTNGSREGDQANIKGTMAKGPYFTAANQRLSFNNMYEEHDFLLHRVSPLEMVVHFVTLAGEVVYTIPIRHLGREAM